MKKLLSLLLTLSMLFSMLAVSAVSATDGAVATSGDERIYKIEAGAKTYELDGVVYNVIWTADDFVSMNTVGKYILGADIALTGKTSSGYGFFDISTSEYNSNWAIELEGNNCSVTDVDFTGTLSIFGLLYGGFISLRNLTFGEKDAPLQVKNTMNSNNGAGVIASAMEYDAVLLCDNVTIYADVDIAKQNAGLFVGNLKSATCNVTLTNCAAYGSVKAAGMYSGFIGYNRGIENFYNCTLGVTGGLGDGLCAYTAADTVQNLKVDLPACEISTAEEFLAINGYNNYKLTSDIDLGGSAVSGKIWSGTLDGDGHSVTNFSTSSGMFTSGYIKGTIKNIILGTETAPININPSNSTGTAVLFGTLDDANTELVCDNVTVYANCEAAYTNVAAFIGQQKNGKAAFTNCTAYVDFDTSASGATSGDATGGFIGHLTAGVATMNRCKVDGTLLAATFVGGFVGRIKAFLSVENSACYADVKALTNYAGGVTGASVTGATMYVTNFLHLGAVEVTSANTVGGLTGNVGGSIYAVNMFTTHQNGVDNDKVSVVTDTQLASGEIAYKLRSAFGQKLGRDQAPVLNSADKVIKRVVAGGAQYENSTDVEDVMSLMYDINEELRWFGRTYTQYGKTFFNWSASGFEFRFKGSGAEAVVLSNAPGGSDTAYIKIYIDGVEQPDVVLDKKENTVVLAKNLDANTEHTIRVVKRTNARSSTAALVSLELTDGEKLAPPEQPKRLIEFVGDSITVGYATIAENQTVWSTATEDSTKTYSKQIADYFDADYMVTAISGRGIARNTGGDTNNLLPDIYGYVDQYNLPGVEYDFARKADVIVINLGTNDASGTNSSLTFEEFGTRLKAFLLDVRAKNPEAEIIYAYGMMRQKFIGTMQTVIKELQDAGDEHISFVVLENCDESSERKLNHPTAEAYISRGEVLIDEIERMTRWGEDDDENGGGNGGENGGGNGNGSSDSTVSGDKNDATTSPVGDATTAEPADDATEETDKPASSGCGSNIGVSMMAATIAVGSAAILLKKKKQKE